MLYQKWVQIDQIRCFNENVDTLLPLQGATSRPTVYHRRIDAIDYTRDYTYYVCMVQWKYSYTPVCHFFTVSAAGDFMIVQLIWREDMRSLVLDHPSEAGCFIYKKED